MRKKFIGGGDGDGAMVLLIVFLLGALCVYIGKLLKEKLNVSTTVAVIVGIILFFVMVFSLFTLYMWYDNRKFASTTI